MVYEELTCKIIRAYFNVYNIVKYGFLESVYEEAMKIELEDMGINYESQFPITIEYKGRKLKGYFADLFVDGKIIVEIKANRELCEDNEKQLLNYLRCTGKEVGLLLNFGRKPEIRRKVFSPLSSDWIEEERYTNEREYYEKNGTQINAD
ncbi:MAG: GxxExxY protein [Nanoarchaeota archaeon]|nr:GxxExxY protein [Nanoarchaeota archaeon]